MPPHSCMEGAGDIQIISKDYARGKKCGSARVESMVDSITQLIEKTVER